jgi:hypothetical protein
MGDNVMSYVPVVGAIREGRKAEKAQEGALKAQEDAQKRAEANAIRQERISGMEKRRANQKTPDVASLMNAARRPASQGAASTMLTQTYGNNTTLG